MVWHPLAAGLHPAVDGQSLDEDEDEISSPLQWWTDTLG